MRRTLVRLLALVTGALAAGSIAAGTAHADPDIPMPEPTFAIICPPVCDVPEPDPEIELNCPPICVGDFPPDLVLDHPCPPDLCGPFPPGGGDEDGNEEEPTAEPTPDDSDQSTGSGDDNGSSSGDGMPSEPASGGTTESAVPTPDAAELAPVSDAGDETQSGAGSNAALLAVVATALGLTAGGGLAYAVLRRR